MWRDCIAIRMFSTTTVDCDTEITLDSESSTVEPLHVDEFFVDDRISELICFRTVTGHLLVTCCFLKCRMTDMLKYVLLLAPEILRFKLQTFLVLVWQSAMGHRNEKKIFFCLMFAYMLTGAIWWHNNEIHFVGRHGTSSNFPVHL